MEIEFDDAKDRVNRVKHGLSLEFGATVVRAAQAEEVGWVDGEERWIAFGFVGLTLYSCVYTMRGRVHRIISVRRATWKEELTWRR